ncbi:hypothetical protein CLV68_3558 [Actinokineospora cianjurensis]|uniref:CDP-glycerol:poly(Glycerophosphate) glycerophosphotransferase n=1 Tax=Actinokineospora cianjurensis TaxID=585224 RepID=A0A421B3R6_9PSEU|nr:hypothetical protein CLV68_3558 [Actinokineospora cianjurensis]
MCAAAEDSGETWPRDRRVCVVLRTRTDLSRVLDVLRAIDGDDRLAIFWTVNEGSQFGGKLRDPLALLDVRLIDWEIARTMEFNLVIAAHTDDALGELLGPVATMAHGTGYNRRVLYRTLDLDAPVGLSTAELVRDGVIVAAAIGLSCESQVEQLSRANPSAMPFAFQMGDPTWDRMLANLGSRDLIRHRLGVTPGQKLVGISSTWGHDSTIGYDPRLVNRVLAALPHDEYRVVLILHPNVWTLHSGFSVRGLLSAASEAGLITVMPTSDWPAALIATDAFIGDHGSVSVYAAALGRPFLFAGRGDDELVKGSTTLDFVRAARPLDPAVDLRDQIVDVMATYAASGVTEVARQAMGNSGESLRLLQARFYELMALDPPAQVPHPRRYAPLEVERDERGVTSFLSRMSLTIGPDCAVTVSVERHPAALAEHHRPVDDDRAPVLVVDEHESNRDLRNTAEVRVRSDDNDADTVWAWIAGTVRDSQCFLAAGVHGSRLLVGTRLGGRWEVRRTAGAPVDSAAVAAAVYHLAVEPGCVMTALEVQVGGACSTLAITQVSADAHSP